MKKVESKEIQNVPQIKRSINGLRIKKSLSVSLIQKLIFLRKVKQILKENFMKENTFPYYEIRLQPEFTIIERIS